MLNTYKFLGLYENDGSSKLAALDRLVCQVILVPSYKYSAHYYFAQGIIDKLHI